MCCVLRSVYVIATDGAFFNVNTFNMGVIGLLTELNGNIISVTRKLVRNVVTPACHEKQQAYHLQDKNCGTLLCSNHGVCHPKG